MTIKELFKENINLRKQLRAIKRKLKFLNKIKKVCNKNGYEIYRNDIENEKSKKITIVLEEEDKWIKE